MTPGTDTNHERTFAALKPALDELTADAYARRRDADLARAMTAGRARRRPRRSLLLAGVAAAALVAVGGVAVLGEEQTRSPLPPAVAERPGDVRSVLLASAQQAQREPTAIGRYWYVRHRETQRVAGVKTGERKTTARKGNLPFRATVAHTQEAWTARDGDDTTRSVTGIDVELTFDSPADEATWKRLGSPQPIGVPERPSVNNYREPVRYTIGHRQLTFAQFAALPTTEAGLEKELRRRYQADRTDPRGPLHGSFTQYVAGTAGDLLAGPVSPGTKAALYRVLARQPGLTLAGQVVDPLGRTGTAVTLRYSDLQTQLIVDTRTGRLLAYRAMQGDRPLLTMAYEAMGWTDRLGARP